MSKNNISGRRDEIRILKRVLTSSDPEFIAVYGRRWVGKTSLVREFFGDLVSFEITGMHHVTLQDQLSNFAQSLGKAAGMALQPQRPSSWSEAFGKLEQLLESSFAKEQSKKQVVAAKQSVAKSMVRFCV